MAKSPSTPVGDSQLQLDRQADASSAVIAYAQRLLEEAAPAAVGALVSVVATGEDGPRVKAATEILDRIGVSRRQLDSSISFPPEMLAGVVAGMAAMMGLRAPERVISKRILNPPSSAGRDSLDTWGIGSGSILDVSPTGSGINSTKPPRKHRTKLPANVVDALTGKLKDSDEEF